MESLGRTLITGGAGFLGRALLRRAYATDADDVIVYSRDELKQSLCRRKYPDARYILGDVRDEERLYLAMLGCDTVIHTAALKYVPEAEFNVAECISVNIGGTLSVLHCAIRAGVERLCVVSTDKAVEPVNVYGMTKALCERLAVEYSRYESTKFTAVRYGNVVGSTGSVVPEFLTQARETGSVRVTNAHMTRFWIGVEDAIDLILTALSDVVCTGSVVIPTPKAMTMGELVRALVPEADVIIVGARPGEKMHETLLSERESPRARAIEEGTGVYELMSSTVRHGGPAFGISSHRTTLMEGDEFLALVEDAGRV